jgi:hypothetical protein
MDGHILYDLEPGNERNLPRPCEPAAFEAELARLTRDCDIEVRLRWAPEVTRYEVDREGNSRLGRVYAVMPKLRQRGWWIGDIAVPRAASVPRAVATGSTRATPGQFILERHSKPDEPLPGECKPIDNRGRVFLDHRTGKVWIRDSYVEQIAFPRWVLEQRIDDDLARRIHAQERFEWVNPATGELCTDDDFSAGVIPVRRDMLGEFPDEGWWRCFLVIAEHRAYCCRRAFPALCYGAYRDPCAPDLEEVKKAIWFRNTQPMLRDKSEPPTAWELNEYIRKTMAEIEAGESRAEQQTIEMLQEALHSPYVVPEVAFADVGAAHKSVLKPDGVANEAAGLKHPSLPVV